MRGGGGGVGWGGGGKIILIKLQALLVNEKFPHSESLSVLPVVPFEKQIHVHLIHDDLPLRCIHFTLTLKLPITTTVVRFVICL